MTSLSPAVAPATGDTVCAEDQPTSAPKSGRKSRSRIDWPNLIVIVLLHLGALLVFVPAFFTWKAVLTALALWVICGLAVTVGYHRLLTHRSFRTPKPIEYLLAWMGSLSLQGGPIRWAATHRLHHQHSDEAEDPHSPKHGFFWAHTLWCFTYDPKFDPFRRYSTYAKDLARDPVHVLLDRLMVVSQLLLGVLLYWWGGWSCVIWAGCLRLVYVYHATWFVNSATHKWGYRSYETGDHSTNLWWVALLSFGEGWHNNHHAFPGSARHGLKRWELDLSWLVIRGMQLVGLARDVRVAEPVRQA